LINDLFDLLFGQCVVLKVFFEVTVTILEDEVEFFISRDYFFQIDDVGMFQYFKEGDFPDCSRGDTLILMVQSDLFDSNYLISLLVTCFVYDSISSLPDFIDALELV